ncbi:MAG: proteasome assembly chaperone 4 family protein, partial [Promethearchaeia archaeon]
YLIWVGSAQPSFANLDVAMCSSMQAMPVTSTLMGSSNEGIGSSLSQRLAMKLKAQVTVPPHLLPCAR